MTPMTVILQFCDPVVKSVQLLLQFLNFVLNRELPSGIFINGFCTRCWQVTVQDSLSLCGHGPSESRMRGYAILSRFSHKGSASRR
jgi:hypothetical protein